MNCNDNIYKCLECSLIPFYCIKYQNKKIYVEQRCQKNHYYFEEFRSFYNNKKCKNINNIKNYCEKHNNNFQYYCKDCKIDICLSCSKEHKKHNLIDLSEEIKNFDINIYKKQIEKAENELNLFTKNCNKIYLQLQEFIKDFNLKFKNFLQFNIEQISFTKDIINIYNYFNKKKEFSYEIIFNIKNIINFKELSYEIDEEFSLLTKSQKFYSIINNNYSTFLNTSNTEINIYYQISEDEKNYLFNKLPPLKDNVPIIYVNKILLQTCNYYYGECQVNSNIKHGRGIIIYKDGGKFIGYFKNGEVEGFGIKYSKNGEIEYGYWKNDNPIGYRTHYYLNGDILKNKITENEKDDNENEEDQTTYSIYKWTNGDMYKGEWKNNNFEGYGIHYISNGDKYEGEWKKNNKDGLGIKVWSNGKIYSGYWKNDTKNGIGKIIQKTGYRYEGEFKHNNYSGKGILYGPKNLLYYKGMWKNSNYDGYGIDYYSNGLKFIEGNWKKNKSNGFVVHYRPNGFKYFIGESKKSELSGFGIFYWEEGKVSKGYWKNNKRNGYGILINDDGSKYFGEFKDNKLEGYGIYYWNDGDFYEGEWKNNQRNGYGRFYSNKTKNNLEGVWDVDNFLNN